MADILPMIYRHRNGYPSRKSSRIKERELMFSSSQPLIDIHHARPCLSSWATRLVGSAARKQIWDLTHDDPDDSEDRVQLRASSNGRGKGNVITREDIGRFSMKRLQEKYNNRAALAMYLTECMAAPHSKGKVVVRRIRPHPMIQVVAISSFIVSRNRYANGDLAMILGIWHFACKSHIDVKRVYCRIGTSVSDTAARAALNSMSSSGFVKLRAEVKDAEERNETEHSTVLDNIQEYVQVYEQGLGRQSQLKVGCAGTALGLQDCEPGAFNADEYHARVARKERLELDVDTLFDSIDWDHIGNVTAVHWVRVLAEFAPEYHHLRPVIAAMFRKAPIAKHRMREGRITPANPLETNSERETETQGMERAVADYDVQMGIDPSKNLLRWIRGDGASYAGILRLIKYCAPLGTFKNKFTTPELWHTGATDLNSIAANHYGPATSSDPSSLSKCSSAAGLKRPSNLKSCAYYPTVRNLTLIWNTHVRLLQVNSTMGNITRQILILLFKLPRLFFECDDLLEHLKGLAMTKELPEIDELLKKANLLVDRYASQAAPQHALSAAEATDPARQNKAPEGTPWDDPSMSSDMPDLVDIQDGPSAEHAPNDAPKVHQEKDGFDGDRVLRNNEIFMMEFGWWLEFASAVPEGDIGRVWEILKIWIFKFAGSSHQNYMAYLLEVYCFLTYEPGDKLKNAVLNNWLVNIAGELGKWLPADLLQEHYNRWLEDMVQKHGAEFDNPFYRETISPNVHHFLRIKEEIETAFSLEHRGKTHTSSHLCAELRLLLEMFKEMQAHLFRSGRSMGHGAVLQFSRGCRRLADGKLAEFQQKSTAFGDILEEIHRLSSESTTGISEDDLNMRTASPAQSNSGSDSIPQSEAGSNRTTSTSSSRSSLSSILSFVDPNKPEDDGEDLSDARLTSGSMFAVSVDPETGEMTHMEEPEECEEEVNEQEVVSEEGSDDGEEEYSHSEEEDSD